MATEEVIPPPPEGFTMIPPPPEGFTLGEPPKSMKEQATDVGERISKGALAAVTGALKAAQNAAGMFGDIHQMFGVPNSPFSTSEDIGRHAGELAKLAGLPPDLPKPETQEGKFIEPMVQTGLSMFAGGGGRGAAAWGAGAGAGGELASRLLDVQGSPEGEGKSGWRTAGQAVVLAPKLAADLMTPRKIAAFGPELKKLGETKADVLAAIDRAVAKADVAAKELKVAHVSPWSQIPELNPAIKELRGSAYGGPLNAQASNELEAIKREVTDIAKLKPHWDPAQGWIDPKQLLGAMVGNLQATENTPLTTIVAQATHSPTGETLERLVNPFRWPGKAIQWERARAGKSELRDLVEQLTSSKAGQALKDIANYSTPGNIISALARSLMALQGGSSGASTESVTLPKLF